MKKLIFVFLFLFSFSLYASTNIAFISNFGNWNVAGNWHLNRVPTENDNPILSGGNTAMIDSDEDWCANIYCGQSLETPSWGKIIMRQDGKLYAHVLILGRDSSNKGMFLLCGGELALSSYLSVGDGDGGSDGTGEISVSAGKLTMLGTAWTAVGYRGYGKMIVSESGKFYANDITVSKYSGSENSEMQIIGGEVVAKNITVGSTETSSGKLLISGGSLVWSNLFYVRDTFKIQNSSPEIYCALNGGTGLTIDDSAILEFSFGANGIATIIMSNSQIDIKSGANIHIDGTYYTRANGVAKSFLLIEHNGYVDETNFLNVTFSGFGGLTPSLRYENNCVYLDLVDSGTDNTARAAQGLFMKYWEIPIDDDNDKTVITAPLSSLPLFTNTLVRVHPVFGKRVEKIDFSETLRADNFMMQFAGYIDIPTNGSYTFYLNSDDGSKLWIDDSLQINNDGQHAATEKSATITLTKGMHKFEVGYFQATGPKTLEVSWQGPNFSKEEIPGNVFYVANVKNAFEEMIAFHNIMPDEERVYNYCPSFMYDSDEGLYKIWCGGAGSDGDYILYKESATLEGLLDCSTRTAFGPSHNPAKFDEVHTCDPNVYCASNGNFYLTYSGNTSGDDLSAVTRVGMAISYDRGRTWARLNNGDHILEPTGTNGYGKGQSAVVLANDGYYYMIFTDVDLNVHSGTYIDVIKCDDPAFPTNKHQLVVYGLQNVGGASVDLAYDSSNEVFIVVVDKSDNGDVVEDPYAKVSLVYYDKNWNFLRSRMISVHPLWSFGEGVALLSDLTKQPVEYSYNGTPSYVSAAATRVYKQDTGLWANWVEGDTKYLITSVATSIPTAPSAQSAYWRFEEGSANIAHSGHDDNWYIDSIANNNNLSAWGTEVNPTATSDVPFNYVPLTYEQNNLALKFTGTECISTADGDVLNSYTFTNGFTVECMVKYNDYAYGVTICKDGRPTSAGDPNFCLKRRGATPYELQFQFFDGSGNRHDLHSDMTPNTGIWYCVAAVCNGSDAKLYIKGENEDYQLVAEETGTVSGSALYNDNQKWIIGRGAWSGAPDNFLNGFVDEVRITNVALSTTLFLGAIPEPSLFFGVIALIGLLIRK